MKLVLILSLFFSLTAINAQVKKESKVDNSITKEQLELEAVLQQTEENIHLLHVEKNDIRLKLKSISENPAVNEEDKVIQKEEETSLIARRDQIDEEIKLHHLSHKEKTISLKELKNKINK